MEKRLILAIVLSALVMLVWSAMLPKQQHPVLTKPVLETQASVPQEVVEKKPLAVETDAVVDVIKENSKIEFLEQTAAIRKIIFSKYQDYAYPLHYGFALKDKLLFKKTKTDAQEIIFKHSDINKELFKRFIFTNSNYSIDLEINVQNNSNVSYEFITPLVVGVLNFKDNPDVARFRDVTIQLADKTIRNNGQKNEIYKDIKFVGLRDRYFTEIVEPVSKNYACQIEKINNNEAEILLVPQGIIIPAKSNHIEKFRIYLGPQDLQLIKSSNYSWGTIINYGAFDIISQVLLGLLELIHKVINNWGLAIIFLSIIIYLLLFPLTLKQMKSMKEMQILQPKIAELKILYKDNPQKFHKETLELYREHKVNPFGGCLPLLLQMPIFFALYQALMKSIVLKGSSFLWIKDLSEPDRLFQLGFSIPFIGKEFNLLPVLMSIIMFIQQKFTASASASSEYAEQQKIMLVLMPVIFCFVFYHMPSGLVLYWFVNSLLTAAYQFRVMKAK